MMNPVFAELLPSLLSYLWSLQEQQAQGGSSATPSGFLPVTVITAPSGFIAIAIIKKSDFHRQQFTALPPEIAKKWDQELESGIFYFGGLFKYR